MRHFTNRSEALDYVFCEVIATLQDDLDRMEWSERYAEADRDEMKARIADIEELAGARTQIEALKRTITYASDYLEACEEEEYSDTGELWNIIKMFAGIAASIIEGESK